MQCNHHLWLVRLVLGWATSVWLLTGFCVPNSWAGVLPAGSGSLRIAVLAVDTAPETRTLADLLTAKLLSSGTLQLVERAEIERLLAEQRLTAAGLVDPQQRILVGRLLRANGFLFFDRNVRKQRLSVRLTETEQGFQVYRCEYEQRNRSLESLADEIALAVVEAAGKLRGDSAARQMVSVLRIGNATLRPGYLRIEEDLPVLLESYFSRHPSIVLLERRQLGALHAEKQWSEGAEAQFPAAGIIIDGEIGPTVGAVLDPNAMPVTFTLRLRRANQELIDRIALNGSLNDVETLAARVAAATMEKILALGLQTQGKPADEAKLFLDVARKQNFLWAAESAYALGTNDPANVQVLIETLVNNALSGPGPRPSASAHENALERARLLARANELYLSCPSNALGDSFLHMFLNHHGFLASPESYSYDDVRDLLKPLRHSVRLAAEKRYDTLPSWIIYHSYAYLEPWEAAAYEQALLLKLLDARGCDRTYCADPTDAHYARMDLFEELLDACSSRFSQKKKDSYEHQARRQFFKSLTTYPTFEVRFYANYALACMLATNQDERVACARLALQEAHKFFEAPRRFSYQYRRNVANVRRRILELFPLCAEANIQFLNKLAAQYEQAFATNNVEMFLGTVQSDYLLAIASNISPEKAIGLIDQASQLCRQLNAGTNRLDGLLALRQELVGAQHPEAVALASGASNDDIRILLSTNTPALAALASRRDRHWNFNDNVGDGCITAQSLLREGNTLWVALGSLNHWQGVGLASVDLRDGQLQSLRIGDVPGIDKKFRYWTDISALCRWNDLICVGQFGVGVHLFPASVDPDDHSLANVRHVTKTNGLYSLHITALAGLSNLLFIACNTVLSCWNRDTGAMTFIAHTEGQLGDSPLSGSGTIVRLAADRSQQRLYVLTRMSPSDSYSPHELWRYCLADREWRQLSPAPYPYQPPRTEYLIVSDTVISFPSMLYLVGCVPHPHKGLRIYGVLNMETEDLVTYGPDKAPVMLSFVDRSFSRDWAVNGPHATTIVDMGPQWKVVQYRQVITNALALSLFATGDAP